MFSVPLIPPDLRHEETIIQAAHALYCLEKKIFTIFDLFFKRIKKNDGKIEILITRLSRAQEKAKELVGTKKSIRISIPSRFPATHIFRTDKIPETFSALLMASQDQASENRNVNEHPYEIKSQVEAPTLLCNNEKLVFFHVRTKELEKARTSVSEQHSLGPIPCNIRSVTSALRFNADEFIYTSDSGSSDSWNQLKIFKKRRQVPQGQSLYQEPKLAPAPHSFTHRNQRLFLAGSLRYTPRLHDVPDLNLPLDLPDLPGVVDDIEFVGEEEQNIAPSLFIENLPDLDELKQAQDLQNKPAQEFTTLNTSEVQFFIPQPPPPPPLPIQPLGTTPTGEKGVFIPLLNKMPTQSDIRSNLMAAIRNAGGAELAKLRPATNAVNNGAERKVTNENGNLGSNSGCGGGLVAELHNKLMLRRKGISGAEYKESECSSTLVSSNNPLLKNLSKLIPQTTANKALDYEDDEDDNDEWAT